MTVVEEMREQLARLVTAIEPAGKAGAEATRARLDSLTKPPGSLGRLEELAVRLGGIQGTDRPTVRRKAVVVMAADHGVTDEGVSPYPSDVTAQMLANFVQGGAAINVLAGLAGARVSVVNMGVRPQGASLEGVIDRSLGPGTANFARGPAMSEEQALRSVLAGVEQAEVETAKGADLLVAGDMGIGNTTAATAVIAALAGVAARDITGPGTGLDVAGVRRKAGVIEAALQNLRPDPSSPLDVLAKVGGFEIGGLAGLFLGAAVRKTPIVADGLISTAGALIAASLAPHAIGYVFAGHMSPEPGHRAALAKLGLRPILDLEMRLGEGTGGALASVVLEAACRICTEMATFAEAGVSDRQS